MALVGTMLAMFGLLALILVGVLAGTQSGGGGLLSLTENADQSAAQQMQSTAAFNLAESGAEYTLQWLHSRSQQYGPPALSHAFPLPAWSGAPGDPAGSYTLGGGTFTVWIFPDANNNGTIITTSGQETPKRYLIQSTGQCSGISQTIQVYVSLSSFGKYAFFTDHDSSTIYWVGGLNSFDGPTHFNGSTGVPLNIVWVDGKPIFNSPHTDAFSYSGSINWYHNSQSSSQQAPQVIYNADGSLQNDQFTNVTKLGSTAVNKEPPITMPPSSLQQQYAALGQTMPAGATAPPANTPASGSPSGVTVTPGGGIYIHSANSADTNDTLANSSLPATDVQQMVLSVDPNGNQVITLQQNTDAGTLTQTQITLDRVNGQTHIQAGPYDSSSQTFTMSSLPDVSGVGNGVIYTDGNIGSTQKFGNANGSPTTYGPDTTPGKGLSGTVADNQALTIATFADPGSNPNNKNINLNGSLVYNTPRARDSSGAFLPESDPANVNFLQKAGTLGLVTNTLQLADNNAQGQPLGDTELDGTTLVQNTLQTVDYKTYYIDQNSANNMGSAQSNGQTYYGHWLRQPHKFYCMGGEIASARGILGAFNSATLQMVSGFGGNYSYDNRLANTPPPFFPTTSSQYQVLSWQRVAVPL